MASWFRSLALALGMACRGNPFASTLPLHRTLAASDPAEVMGLGDQWKWIIDWPIDFGGPAGLRRSDRRAGDGKAAGFSRQPFQGWLDTTRYGQVTRCNLAWCLFLEEFELLWLERKQASIKTRAIFAACSARARKLGTDSPGSRNCGPMGLVDTSVPPFAGWSLRAGSSTEPQENRCTPPASNRQGARSKPCESRLSDIERERTSTQSLVWCSAA